MARPPSAHLGYLDLTLSPISTVNQSTGFLDTSSTPNTNPRPSLGGMDTPVTYNRSPQFIDELVRLSSSLASDDPLKACFTGIINCVLTAKMLDDSTNDAAQAFARFASDVESANATSVIEPGGPNMRMSSTAGRESLGSSKARGAALIRVDIANCTSWIKELTVVDAKFQTCSMFETDTVLSLSNVENHASQIRLGAAASRDSLETFLQDIDRRTRKAIEASTVNAQQARTHARHTSMKLMSQRDALGTKTIQRVEEMQTRLKQIAASKTADYAILHKQISELDEYDDKVGTLEAQRDILKEEFRTLMDLLKEVNEVFRQCTTIPCLERSARQAGSRQETANDSLRSFQKRFRK